MIGAAAGSLAATTSFPAFKAPTGPLSFSQNVSSSSALSNGSGFTWGNSMDAAGLFWLPPPYNVAVSQERSIYACLRVHACLF